VTKISQLSSIGDSLAIGDQFLIRDIDDAGSPNKSVTVSGITRALADGDATAPALAFAADKNTGIYRAGTDSLAVATNGTGRLFVDATGRVGIGATPTARLHLQTTSENAVLQMLENNGSTVYGASIDAFNSSGGNIRFRLHDSGGTFQERLRITSAGLVGIGTSSPGHKFHVVSADTTTPGFFQHIDGTTTLGNSFSTIHRVASDGNNRYSLSAWQVQNDSGLTQRAFIGSRAVTGAANYNPLMVFGTTTGSGTYDTRMVIDGSGRVGIGITSPSSKFHLYDASNVSMRIEAGAGVPQIELKSSTGSQIISAGGGGTQNLAFTVAGSERFRVDSSGRLLIGTSTELAGGSSTTLLQVAASTGGLLAISRSGATTNAGDVIGEIAFFDNESGNDKCAAILCAGDLDHASGDKPSRLVFSTTSDSASSPTERLRITSTGQVRLAGAGITFNGDTAAANELDDYEEGTFTPTIEGTTTAGTATYTRQAGVYTKVGRQVFYAIDVIYASGTGTGNLRIAGLPFTSSSTSMLKTGAIFADNIALTADNYPAVVLSLNSTVLLIKQLPTGGGASSDVPYDAAGQLILTATYFV
jgi:hypothetical protein